MRNLMTIQRLKIVSLVLSALFFLIEIIPLLGLPKVPRWLVISLMVSKPVDFPVSMARLFVYHDFDSGLSTNFLTAVFYFLMLIGAILFWRKEQKEIRLLRFSYAIILLQSVTYVLNIVLGLAMNGLAQFGLGVLYTLLIYIKIGLILYLSWLAVKLLNAMREIDLVPSEDQPQTPVLASRWHRFFHLIVDTTFAALIFFPFLTIYFGDFFQRLSDGAGERAVIFLVLIISRLLYYSFFEKLFGATPAKMFSETRVVTRNAQAISLDQSLYRTLSRFVPFEPFSFLGDTGGWHDRWTETSVVKEKRRGVKGVNYFVIAPIILLIGGVGYGAHSAYKDYKREQWSRKNHQENVALLESQLQKLSLNTIIKLRSNHYDDVYLKPEDINKDEIYCSVYTPNESALSPHAAGEYYKANQYSLNKVMIDRKELMQSYEKEYEVELVSSRKSLLNDQNQYEIEQIFELDQPLLKSTGSGSIGGNSLSLSIDNCGWGGTLKEVRTLIGDATFSVGDELPYEVKPSYKNSFSCASLTFYSYNYERGSDYSFEFLLMDQNGKDHRYVVTGIDMDRTLKEVIGDR